LLVFWSDIFKAIPDFNTPSHFIAVNTE